MMTLLIILLSLLTTRGVIGHGSFVPKQLIDEGFLDDDIVINKKNQARAAAAAGDFSVVRLLQAVCPPPFSGGDSCDPPLETQEEWQACANACGPAVCCQDTCANCPSCGSYLPCAGLGPPPGPGGGGTSNNTCDVFSVDYYEGFQLNFKIRKSEAKMLMLYSWFTPMKIDVIEDTRKKKKAKKGRRGSKIEDPRKKKKAKKARRGNKRGSRRLGEMNGENTNNELGETDAAHNKNKRNQPYDDDDDDYQISMYASKIGTGVNIGGEETIVGRADLFTYAIDPDGETALVILAAFMEVPEELQGSEDLLELYKESVESSSLDSRTGKTAYPHYYVFQFEITERSLVMGGGDLGDVNIQIKIKDDCNGRMASFSRDFVFANSYAYRSPIDKNVNFFNRDFIGAHVLDLPVTKKCLIANNLDVLFSYLPEKAVLKSAQSYGSSDKAITWHYEDDTNSTGTPYFTLAEKDERINFKREAFGGIWSQRAEDISTGAAETIVTLITGRDNIYVNWELSDEGVDQLSEDLNLERLGLTMSPIQVLPYESPRYLLTLNAYKFRFEGVPGDAGSGVRFEYSIYVRNQDDHRPYYMIIEALSSVDSFDPVNGQVPASDISHSREGVILSLRRGDSWLAKFVLKDTEQLSVEKQWIMATDMVYWPNGVADQVYYDDRITLQPVNKPSLDGISGSNWFDKFLVDPSNPVHSLVYEKPIQFTIVPWFNLNDESLPLPPPTRAMLQGLKSTIYGGLASLTAALVKVGQQEPPVDVLIYVSPETPRIALNFEIPKKSIRDLERVIGLPDDLHIVPMSMTAESEAKYMMNVEVLTETLVYGGDPYKKAVWIVFIEDQAGNVYLNQFHKEATSPILDVEEILKPPAEVFEYTMTNDSVHVYIKNGDFEVAFDVPKPISRKKIDYADEWVNAHSKVYEKKGVYSKLFYNGDLWDGGVIPVRRSSVKVSQTTPWSAFVKDAPFEVYFHDAGVTFISNPWSNIEEI